MRKSKIDDDVQRLFPHVRPLGCRNKEQLNLDSIINELQD